MILKPTNIPTVMITPTDRREEAQKVRVYPGIPVRTYEEDGKLVWSKVDEDGKDLTLENSEGVIYHVRSVYVPHGAPNPLEDFL